jgi:hypothetical protein
MSLDFRLEATPRSTFGKSHLLLRLVDDEAQPVDATAHAINPAQVAKFRFTAATFRSPGSISLSDCDVFTEYVSANE